MLEGLTTVDGFKGKAHVFGAEHEVQYGVDLGGETPVFLIKGLTFDKVQLLLALVHQPAAPATAAKAAITAVQDAVAVAKEVTKTEERVRIEELPQTAAAPEPAKKTKTKKAAAATNGAATNGVHAAAAPAPEAVEPAVKEEPKAEARRHGPVSAARPVPASEPPEGASDFVVDDGDEDADEEAEAGAHVAPEGEAAPADASDLVPYLVKRTKLQPILFDILDFGFRTVEDIIRVCEELKPKVPVLGRISNFAERVPLALEAYGVDDPATYHPDNRAEYDQSERLF